MYDFMEQVNDPPAHASLPRSHATASTAPAAAPPVPVNISVPVQVPQPLPFAQPITVTPHGSSGSGLTDLTHHMAAAHAARHTDSTGVQPMDLSQDRSASHAESAPSASRGTSHAMTLLQAEAPRPAPAGSFLGAASMEVDACWGEGGIAGGMAGGSHAPLRRREGLDGSQNMAAIMEQDVTAIFQADAGRGKRIVTPAWPPAPHWRRISLCLRQSPRKLMSCLRSRLAV